LDAVDVLVANHAISATGDLAAVSAEQLDLAFAVNARATVLLVQAFAARHEDARPDGRILLFTSGQHRGPMADELAYAIRKGAVQQRTASLADDLAHCPITVNARDPGPVDRGVAELSCVTAFAAGRKVSPRAGSPTSAARALSYQPLTDEANGTPNLSGPPGGGHRTLRKGRPDRDHGSSHTQRPSDAERAQASCCSIK
jgi:3-oxoacyl-[acyl-carrier protein] reductase